MHEILSVLEDSRQKFLAASEGVPEAEANTAPAPGRWSVLECVEHVTTVEERFLGWLESGKKLDAPRIDPQKEADLAARVQNRATKAEAPEPVRPVGRFGSLAQAREQFNTTRDRSKRFAEERAADLYSLVAEHPRFGPMNGVEFLTIIAGHALRHAAQIHEARAAFDLAKLPIDKGTF